MMAVDKELSRRIANMSVVCMILVVVQHCDIGGWINGHFGVFTRVAVPWFFLASGFFFIGHISDNGWYAEALRKRTKRLEK